MTTVKIIGLRALTLFFVGLLLSACASTPGVVDLVSSPFEARHARLFDDGVDYFSSGAGLSGRWRSDWEQDLLDRASQSDLVAVVSVRTVRTDTAPSGRVTYRVEALLDRALYAPGGYETEQVDLSVNEKAQGFRTVRRDPFRLEKGSFMLYAKWSRRSASGGRSASLRLHWHLSPSSQTVLAMTEKVLSERLRARRLEERR